MNAILLNKVLFKTLLKLVRKYGVVLVLQGLIEAAKLDKKNPKMQVLVTDLGAALTKYKSSK